MLVAETVVELAEFLLEFLFEKAECAGQAVAKLLSAEWSRISDQRRIYVFFTSGRAFFQPKMHQYGR